MMTVSSLFVLLIAGACGQKGDLYLPGDDGAGTTKEDRQDDEQGE